MSLLRVCLIGWALALSAGAAYADVYRWVDDEGVVHFGDEPRAGAERIDVPEPATVQMPEPAADSRSTPADEAAEDDDQAGYERFAIASPGQEQTIQSAPGQVPVTLSLRPALREGHRIRLLLDGTPVDASPTRALEVTLGPLDRGTHRLEARVLDADGDVLARTEAVTFYLHRPSVNLPTRQGN